MIMLIDSIDAWGDVVGLELDWVSSISRRRNYELELIVDRAVGDSIWFVWASTRPSYTNTPSPKVLVAKHLGSLYVLWALYGVAGSHALIVA